MFRALEIDTKMSLKSGVPGSVTVSLATLYNSYIERDKKLFAHGFAQTINTISLKNRPRRNLRSSGQAYHRLAGLVKIGSASATFTRR